MRTLFLLGLIALTVCSQFDIRSQSRCTDTQQGFCTRWEQNGTVEEMMAGCFPASARVYTPKGLLPMNELRKGDKVLAVVGEKEEWATVTGWLHHNEEEAEYLKLNLQNGWVKVSAKHNIAAEDRSYIFADQAVTLFGLGGVSSVQKVRQTGLYAPKTTSNNYYVHVEGTESEKMLAHCFAHIRNPVLYEGLFGMIESAWDIYDSSAVNEQIHPSYTWMRDTFTFLQE